ncbi:MAG: hypothetical protein E6I52_29285 [Chloroflexi bacterium]|nr:MAG: hypothetical protein E6I52_29285 [Chloroflexota bacterium]
MGVDLAAELFVAARQLDLVEDWIGVDEDQTRDTPILVRAGERARDVQQQVRGANHRRPLGLRKSVPGSPGRESIGPAVSQAETRHDARQVFDIEGAVADGGSTGGRTVDRVAGVLEVVDVMAQPPQTQHVLEVVPGHPAQRVLGHQPGHDDAERRRAHAQPATWRASVSPDR